MNFLPLNTKISKENSESLAPSPEGEMVKEYRAAKKQGLDAVAEMVSELKLQLQALENIRNFVRDFRDKKITIKEFLAGPGSNNNISEEEILEMILGKLLAITF